MDTKELAKKLEKISALYKDVLAIKQKMNSFIPKDEYERSIVIPDFPEVEGGEKDKSTLLKAVQHENEDAVYLNSAMCFDINDEVFARLCFEFPMVPLCSEDCKGLCLKCGQNLNLGDCGCEDDNIDPRWEGLKAIMDNTDN